jgi:transposase, IS6 family
MKSRLVEPGMGFSSLETAWRALQGYEVLNSMREGQVQGRNKGDSTSQIAFISSLFGMAA